MKIRNVFLPIYTAFLKSVTFILNTYPIDYKCIHDSI